MKKNRIEKLFAALRDAPRRCSKKTAIRRVLLHEPRERWLEEIMRATGDDLATTFKTVCDMEQSGELDKLKHRAARR